MDDRKLYIVPDNFKNGAYFLSRFNYIDIALLIICISAGLVSIIFGSTTSMALSFYFRVFLFAFGVSLILGVLLLTLNINYFHNVLGRLISEIRFIGKTKEYKYIGICYEQIDIN